MNADTLRSRKNPLCFWYHTVLVTTLVVVACSLLTAPKILIFSVTKLKKEFGMQDAMPKGSPAQQTLNQI